MSVTFFKAPVAHPNRLQPIIDWLRQARAALTHPIQDIDSLSDRHLTDIGAEKPDITRAVDREVGRLGLLDIGWQQPRWRGRR